MWTCPKCKESIEDQFDSCWKCAGAAQPTMPTQDLVWMYPLISFAALTAFIFMLPVIIVIPKRHDPYVGIGGALFGIVLSSVGIWAFFRCPLRHWFAKILTLLLLIAALFCGMVAVGSFLVHVFGYDAA
jgi:hypothetical protein